MEKAGRGIAPVAVKDAEILYDDLSYREKDASRIDGGSHGDS